MHVKWVQATLKINVIEFQFTTDFALVMCFIQNFSFMCFSECNSLSKSRSVFESFFVHFVHKQTPFVKASVFRLFRL